MRAGCLWEGLESGTGAKKSELRACCYILEGINKCGLLARPIDRICRARDARA